MARDPTNTKRRSSKDAVTKKLESVEKLDKWGRKLLKTGKVRPRPKNWGVRKPLFKDVKFIGLGPPAGPKPRP